MNTTNLLSKVINSDKLETVNGLNQALECVGVVQDSKSLNRNQANELKRVFLEKFAAVVDLKKLAESIKESVSFDEWENFRQELKVKLSNNTAGTLKSPICHKRIDTLKSCFEEVSGDNVL